MEFWFYVTSNMSTIIPALNTSYLTSTSFDTIQQGLSWIAFKSNQTINIFLQNDSSKCCVYFTLFLSITRRIDLKDCINFDQIFCQTSGTINWNYISFSIYQGPVTSQSGFSYNINGVSYDKFFSVSDFSITTVNSLNIQFTTNYASYIYYNKLAVYNTYTNANVMSIMKGYPPKNHFSYNNNPNLNGAAAYSNNLQFLISFDSFNPNGNVIYDLSPNDISISPTNEFYTNDSTFTNVNLAINTTTYFSRRLMNGNYGTKYLNLCYGDTIPDTSFYSCINTMNNENFFDVSQGPITSKSAINFFGPNNDYQLNLDNLLDNIYFSFYVKYSDQSKLNSNGVKFSFGSSLEFGSYFRNSNTFTNYAYVNPTNLANNKDYQMVYYDTSITTSNQNNYTNSWLFYICVFDISRNSIFLNNQTFAFLGNFIRVNPSGNFQIQTFKNNSDGIFLREIKFGRIKTNYVYMPYWEVFK